MGLEQFMDLGVEKEETTSQEQEDENDGSQPSYDYEGDEELVEFSLDDVREVLTETEYGFEIGSVIGKDKGFDAESPGGKWLLTVQSSIRTSSDGEERHIRDALLVTIRHSDTGYNVIEPYPVYRTSDWRANLRETVQTVTDNKDELVFCDKCGGVRIIRTTNRTGERIRGCSNYPDCRKSEKL